MKKLRFLITFEGINMNHKLQWSSFMRSNHVSRITTNNNIDISGQAISDVNIYCINDEYGDYKVSFKLGDDCAEICQYLVSVNNQPDFTIQLSEQAQQCDESQLKSLFDQFMKLIKPRLKEAQKEQEIQSIEFIGNTFILNNHTTFRVLTDDGEGRLTIEILGSKNDEQQPLNLSSHGLLDSLYLGSIKVAQE